MTLHLSDYGYSSGDIGPSTTEVQITHEKSEWAYAVYVMGPGGCEYSWRFEYDADKRSTRVDARAAAVADYKRQIAARPGVKHYNDL